MSFSISTFAALVKPVRPNMFYAEITLPPNIFSNTNRQNVRGSANRDNQKQAWFTDLPLNEANDVNTRFRCRCEATELPGRTIATADDTTVFGPSMKYAYDHTYADHTLQIIASDDMYERKVFEAWMDNIVNGPDLYGSATSKSGLIRYYDDYAGGQVRIHQLNEQGITLAKYTLFNAYPIALSPMNLTWEEQNTYQRFSVTMTYRYHVVNFNNSTLTI
jgi:hypothetical protein